MKKHAENAPVTAENAQTSPSTADAVVMPVPPWKRLAGAFLAGIPFFFTLPYTIHSWRSSPMDRWNWIFHLAFLALAACAAPAVKDSAKKNRCDFFALLAVAAAAVLYMTGIVRHIYMIRILAGTAFWWTGVWFFCGWPGGWALLPAFGALSLGCTSSTFVLCNHFLIQPQTILFLKLGATVLCAAVCAVFMLTDFVMKREVFWFLLAAVAILAGSLMSHEGGQTASPFCPDLTVAPEGFNISGIPLTPDQVRFFEGSEVHQYRIDNGVFQCSILEVKCGGDIHKIHPASHCLRSGGAVIQSESVVMHTLPDGRALPVTEIRSRRADGITTLTFVWYTGPKETLGSFFRFRGRWSPSDQWYSYQIVTRVYDGNDEAARMFLLDVLSKF
jgi:hypothetical protein